MSFLSLYGWKQLLPSHKDWYLRGSNFAIYMQQMLCSQLDVTGYWQLGTQGYQSWLGDQNPGEPLQGWF